MANVAKAQTDIEDTAPKPKKGRGAKKKGLVGQDLTKTTAGIKTSAIGHNSGTMHPELVTMMEQDLLMDENKKAISKDQREIRNNAKDKFGILASAWNYEKKLRKLATDARIQHESNHHDLKVNLGYQASLDLKPNTVARTEQELVDPSAAADALINQRAH